MGQVRDIYQNIDDRYGDTGDLVTIEDYEEEYPSGRFLVDKDGI